MWPYLADRTVAHDDEANSALEDAMTVEPVVVGVDHSVEARSAVVWAAQEAVLAGSSLLVVHSPRLPAAGTAGFLSAALRASDDVGQSILDSCAELARSAEPGLVVRTLLSHADHAQALIDVSAQAQLVVLGARHGPAGEISLLASKRLQVIAHSHCPVLLLGPVSSFSPPGQVSRVVAGLAATRAGVAAVRFAAFEAARRHVTLQLVRLEPAQPKDDLPEVEQSTGDRQQADQSEPQVAAIRREYPELTVQVDTVAGDAAELLPSYSDSSSILVIGCHHTDDHWSTRLGPVATSVVHRNHGAVIVVGSARHSLVEAS